MFNGLCVPTGALLTLFLLTPSQATQVEVTIDDFFFSPAQVKVLTGDAVRWTNMGAALHTSSSGIPPTKSGVWDSGALDTNQTFAFTFITVGSYPYFCSIHTSMRGTVQVLAPVSAATAKGLADGTVVGLRGVVVIARFPGSGFYAESDDRVAGLFVAWSSPPTVGAVVDAIGVLTASGCQRQLAAEFVRPSSQAAQAIRPLGMANKTVGGVPDNKGLLVKVWGKATANQGADYFTLDDGSLAGGLKISSGSLTKPPPGQFVTVVGASSCEGTPGIPVVVPRTQGDIQ